MSPRPNPHPEPPAADADPPPAGGLRAQLPLPTAAAVLGWAGSRTGMSLVAVIAIVFLAVFALAHGRAVADRLLPTGSQALTTSTAVRQLREQVAALTVQLVQARRRATASAAGLAAAAELAVRTEENVRAVIVAELHDTVTQSLIAAAYATYDPDVERHQLTAMMQEAERELRTVMLDQSPLRSDTETLGDMMAALVRKMRTRHGLTVSVEWAREEFELLYPQAMGIYRFIHEALTNVAKHAGVDTAQVTVEAGPGFVTTTVTDDGVGFDPTDAAVTERLGLGLLEKRCAIVGGILAVHAAPGAGTRLTLRVPRTLEPVQVAA